MGVIAKQSIKGSIYTYAGAILGFINTGLLMPNFFEKKEVGLVFLLIALTLIFSQFANLGFPHVNTRIFPFFRDEKEKNNGILTLGIIVTFIGILISFLIFYLLLPYFTSEDYDNTGLFANNVLYIPILIFFTTFFNFFDSYTKALFDAVTGTLLKDFLVKLLNIIITIAFIYKLIDFDRFVFLYVLVYISPFFLILLILFNRKKIHLSVPNKQLLQKYKPEILKVALFGIISGFSGIAIMNIDKTMVTDFLGMDAMGVYSVCFYFGVLISLPSRPLRKISSIFLAEAWKNNNIEEVKVVYQKSISTLFLIGTLIYVGIIINIDNIFKLIPDYQSGRNVILLIGAAYLVDMLSGTSASIISNSKHYKVLGYIMMATVGLVIITNIIFIPIWQLSGAAFASFITIVVAFFMRFLFLYFKYKLQPYFYKHFLILIIGLLMLAINYFIPENSNFVLDIIIRSSVITILFASLSYFLKISEDANKLVNLILYKLGFISLK